MLIILAYEPIMLYTMHLYALKREPHTTRKEETIN